jgi:hypothetical protein
MRAARLTAALALLVVTTARADNPPDPLRLVPRQADLVLRVESPRKLVESIQTVEPLRELRQFTAVRELLASTNVRRLEKILAYYEQELGAAWPDLLDRLTGGGVVVSLKFERGGNAPVLLVVQSKDEALLKQTLPLVLKVIEQEQARQGSKERPRTDTYREQEVIHIGNDIHVAQAGSALLVSNQAAGIHSGLDLHLNGSQESMVQVAGPADARKLMPPDALWSLWVNLVPAQQSPEGQQLFKQPRNEPGQTVIFGGLLDVLGQSPFLAAGGYYQPDGTFRVSVRMPRGRDATPEGAGLHLAPVDGPGCLPPLEPKNVLFSTSFYLDQGKFWTERDKLLTENGRKQLDQAEKAVGSLLAGRKLSELLTQSGPYHRFVAAAQEKCGYAKHPQQTIPAFAYAISMRDPGFGQSLEAILRASALFAGGQYRLKMVEEEIDGVKLVGYRFPEDGSVPGDTQNIRFNFSPCFAAVGDQFFAASTIEFGREMVGVLKRPGGQAPAATTADVSRAYAAGVSALLKVLEDQILVQAALSASATLDEARQEVQAFINLLNGLGRLDMQTDYLPREFRFEVQWIHHKDTKDTKKATDEKK